jgi:hypothetical protein
MSDGPLFSDAYILQRCFDLHASFEVFKATYEAKTTAKVSLGIDPAVLYLAVKSYFDDITRFKRYHLSDPPVEKADSVKQSAFMVKWLTRMKPIFVLRKHDFARGTLAVDPNDESALINEAFALSIGFEYLGIYLTKAKYKEILYDLSYRRLTDDGLLLFFQTLKDIEKGTPVIAS